MTDWLGLPPLASAHGGQIDSMIGWVHVFMLILFIGWGGFFATALIRFRRSRHPVANYTGVKSHTSSYLEVGVAVVEAILLFGFAIPLWAARVDAVPPESEALVVQITGEQFAWNVHYAGPDGVFGRTDISLLDVQENPLGIDRADPAAVGVHGRGLGRQSRRARRLGAAHRQADALGSGDPFHAGPAEARAGSAEKRPQSAAEAARHLRARVPLFHRAEHVLRP